MDMKNKVEIMLSWVEMGLGLSEGGVGKQGVGVNCGLSHSVGYSQAESKKGKLIVDGSGLDKSLIYMWRIKSHIGVILRISDLDPSTFVVRLDVDLLSPDSSDTLGGVPVQAMSLVSGDGEFVMQKSSLEE